MNVCTCISFCANYIFPYITMCFVDVEGTNIDRIVSGHHQNDMQELSKLVLWFLVFFLLCDVVRRFRSWKTSTSRKMMIGRSSRRNWNSSWKRVRSSCWPLKMKWPLCVKQLSGSLCISGTCIPENTHTFEPVIGGTASYLFYHHLGNFLLLSSKTNFANWSMMADVASQIYRRGIAKTWRRGEKNSTENYSSEGRAIAGRDLSCRGKSAIILCSLFYLNLHIFLTGKGL